MRYLIVYDVSDDRARSRVAMALEGFGPRVQESVLEAEMAAARTCASSRVALRRFWSPKRAAASGFTGSASNASRLRSVLGR